MTTTKQLLTFEQFLDYDDGTDNIYELVAGQVVPMSKPSGRHESISTFILVELGFEIRHRRLNLEPHSKILCKLDKRDGRRPDLIVIRRNLNIQVPTVSVGVLDAKNRSYRWKEFTGRDRIESALFPSLQLTVEQVVAAKL